MISFGNFPKRRSEASLRSFHANLDTIPGLVFWINARMGVQASSTGSVVSVRDVGPHQLVVTPVGNIALVHNAVHGLPAFDTSVGSSYLTVGHSNAITFGTGDFTILAVSRQVNASASYGMLYGKFEYTSPFRGPIVFHAHTTTDTVFRVDGNNGTATPTDDNDNVWRIRWYIREHNVLSVYHGFVVVSRKLVQSISCSDTNDGFILGRPDGVQQVRGQLAEFALWNRAVGEAERISLTRSLVGIYDLGAQPEHREPRPSVALPRYDEVKCWLDPAEASYVQGRCAGIAYRGVVFSQATTTARPWQTTYHNAPALQFNGGQWLLSDDVVSKLASWTMVALVVPETIASNTFVFSSNHSNGSNATFWSLGQGGYGAITKLHLTGFHSDQASGRYCTCRTSSDLPSGLQVWAASYTLGETATRLYVNGMEQASSPIFVSSPAPNANVGTNHRMAVGRGGEWSGSWWSGTFLEGGWWSVALTPSEILNLSCSLLYRHTA
ncbi:MAG: hypothetical protein EI684_05070 [Candidatus Viridilinea halotolerans]|uniref:LamG domain-containing protein n=1 Tax=Candidatus Viridilinea halotolerans TaxID=2491704 RepID=A0A426U5Q0_9CHLR|nr:MAG: hypothetical protein EI684_05070 [Candidatus Viridilinea halotolerans]